MNNITLYHYSNSNFKGYIKPEFFGLNCYSGYSKRVSQVKRSYFYLTEGIKEYNLSGARFLYIIEVDKNKLYNLDSNKIIAKDIYKAVKSNNFKGLYNSQQVVLFYPVKIKECQTLTK